MTTSDQVREMTYYCVQWDVKQLLTHSCITTDIVHHIIAHNLLHCVLVF